MTPSAVDITGGGEGFLQNPRKVAIRQGQFSSSGRRHLRSWGAAGLGAGALDPASINNVCEPCTAISLFLVSDHRMCEMWTASSDVFIGPDFLGRGNEGAGFLGVSGASPHELSPFFFPSLDRVDAF